ncbi:addiction module protein [Haloferula sp.]|uniref:addiction module protein n=1 Tax=Haloferula sp. TaxID=2497595 RepID=UPI003C7374F4
MKLEDLGAEALKLDESDRAELMHLIMDSLEGADPNDSDEDSLTEAIRRGEELRTGKVEGIPEAEFMDEFRAERERLRAR